MPLRTLAAARRGTGDIVSSAPPKAWKRGISSRLRKIADGIHDDDHLTSLVAPELPPPPSLPAVIDADDVAARDRALVALITECYPTVAPKVLALVREGGAAASDDWIIVARLLYDAHMHRVGGPSETARMRALVATFAQALEEQARSSARLAGYHDAELDNVSTIEGDPPGITIWEHYLCPPAKLARQAIHGESVGDWLTALGELWGATKALADRCEAAGPAPAGSEPGDLPVGTTDPGSPNPLAPSQRGALTGPPTPQHPASGGASEGEPETDQPTAVAIDDPVLLRARIALARVEELALW